MNNTRLIEIKDVDLIVIDEIKKITEDYQINKNSVLTSLNITDVILLVIPLMLFIGTFYIKEIVSQNGIIAILIFIFLFFVLSVQGIIKSKIKYYAKFYLYELKLRKIKIIDEVFYEKFLERYVAYKIFKIQKRLNVKSYRYYKKQSTTELTEEEIFISIIAFPRKYDLEEEPSSDAGD